MGISSIAFSCDPEQATQFNANGKGRVGYLTHLKIGKDEFKAKKSYMGPEGKKIECVGIVTNFRWSGGELDTVGLNLLVPPAVRVLALQYMDSKATDSAVEIAFEIFDHEVKEKDKKTVYYKGVFTDKTIHAAIAPDGTNHLIFRADPDADENYKESLYPVLLTIMPATGEQAIHYARVEGSPQAAEWGHK
jgi:hypothetical protein